MLLPVALEIEKLIDDYTQWLRKEIIVEDVGQYYEITTSFLDNVNDYIQFYAKLDGDAVFLLTMVTLCTI